MLSDEEKEALEILNNTEWDGFMITIKNLIKKQSKEIEELKEKNKKLQDRSKELIFEKQELTSALLDSTPNDKIKAKIEEYEKALNILLQKNEWIEPSDTIIRNKFMHYIEFGQSLLEKE